MYDNYTIPEHEQILKFHIFIPVYFVFMGNLNVIFSFCREINGEKKNFCLVTNPRKKLKYRMFTEVES